MTCDHVVVYRDTEASIEGSRSALIAKDVGASFVHAFPSGRKSTGYHSLTHFVSDKDSVGIIYSDNAIEIATAIKDLGWRHEQSKAYIHQSNALAERVIRTTTEGLDPTLSKQAYDTHSLEHACVCHSASSTLPSTIWHRISRPNDSVWLSHRLLGRN